MISPFNTFQHQTATGPEEGSAKGGPGVWADPGFCQKELLGNLWGRGMEREVR